MSHLNLRGRPKTKSESAIGRRLKIENASNDSRGMQQATNSTRAIEEEMSEDEKDSLVGEVESIRIREELDL